MDIKYLDLKFESNNKILEVGRVKPFRLLNIDGIDSGENELYTTSNILHDGSKITNKRIKSRPIMIEAEYKGIDKERKRSELAGFFNIHREGILTIDYQGIKRSIRYNTESYKAKLNNLYEPLSFLINLYCPNPYWQDIEDSKTDISTETGNIEFPLEIPTGGLELSIRTISFITNIYNQGDVETPIKVKLKATGTVINPIIENLSTGEYIRVKRTLAKGDTLEINTAFGNKRVEIIKPDGTRENVFHYIDYKSTFFSLSDGDNTIKYDAEVGENNLDVSIYYTPNYLGI